MLSLDGVDRHPGSPSAAPVLQMPEGGRLPTDVAYGEFRAAAERGPTAARAVGVQAGVSSRRGGQTLRKGDSRPSGGAHGEADSRMAR